jgi:hypothetical protein
MKAFRGVTFLAVLCFVAPSAWGAKPEAALPTAGKVDLRFYKPLDLAGKTVSLVENERRAGTAFVFISSECPIARQYIPELNRLAASPAAEKVPLVGVLSDRSVSRAEAKRFCDEFKLDFRVIFDATGELAEITSAGTMPPWKAELGHGEFLDERRLTEREIALIKTWAASGTPRGDEADLPPQPEFPSGWRLGTPDVVVEAPTTVTVPPDGGDIFHHWVMPIEIPEDKTLVGIEFRPGNPAVVHHAIIGLDTTGGSRRRDEATPEPGYRSSGSLEGSMSAFLGVWTPGMTPRFYPEDVGYRIPKKADVLLQLHLHPSGREVKVTATYPTAETESLIWIKDWNFYWQDVYVYKEAKTLPKGTKVEIETWYDNSAENPFNPSKPPKPVLFGNDSDDEMCFILFQTVSEDDSVMRKLGPAMMMSFMKEWREANLSEEERAHIVDEAIKLFGGGGGEMGPQGRRGGEMLRRLMLQDSKGKKEKQDEKQAEPAAAQDASGG